MILVKITILVFVIAFVYNRLLVNWLSKHPDETLKIGIFKDSYWPLYRIVEVVLNMVALLLIIASVIWFVFFFL